MAEQNESIEHKKRFDMVLGIMLAAVLGFVINLLANTYYDLFVTHAMTWKKIDHGHIYGLGIIVLGLVGFLDFFIEDYKNDVEVTRSSIRRFINHFFYKFVAGRILRFVVGIYLSLFLLAVVMGAFVAIGQLTNYYIAVFLAILLSPYIVKVMKERNK